MAEQQAGDEHMLNRFRSFFPKKTRKEIVSLYKFLLPDGKNCFLLNDFKNAIKGWKNYDKSFSEDDFVKLYGMIERGAGKIVSEDLVTAVRGSLGQYKKLIVDYVFKQLDKNNSNAIEEGEMAEYFKSGAVFADILVGASTPRDKTKDFMKRVARACGMPSEQKMSKITIDQLYQCYLDQGIDNDSAFSRFVLDEWLLKDDNAQKFVKEFLKNNNEKKKLSQQPPSDPKPSTESPRVNSSATLEPVFSIVTPAIVGAGYSTSGGSSLGEAVGNTSAGAAAVVADAFAQNNSDTHNHRDSLGRISVENGEEESLPSDVTSLQALVLRLREVIREQNEVISTQQQTIDEFFKHIG